MTLVGSSHLTDSSTTRCATGRFDDLEVRVQTVSCVEQAVLVEESVRVGVADDCLGHTVPAFAAFLISDFQIIGWNQRYG
jgi:hypothetical protein